MIKEKKEEEEDNRIKEEYIKQREGDRNHKYYQTSH